MTWHFAMSSCFLLSVQFCVNHISSNFLVFVKNKRMIPSFNVLSPNVKTKTVWDHTPLTEQPEKKLFN